jgi:hypothetical protein
MGVGSLWRAVSDEGRLCTSSGTWFGNRCCSCVQFISGGLILHTAGWSIRLAESFQDESDLLAQARFGVFAVLNAVLDQNRVEERRERGVDRTGRFCRSSTLSSPASVPSRMIASKIVTIRSICALMIARFSCMAATIMSCMRLSGS